MKHRITRLYITIASFVLVFHTSFGQAYDTFQYRLSGEILDAQGQPIELGNILILSPRDSSLIAGDYFTNGRFLIENLTSPRILLRITALGYADHYKLVDNSAAEPQKALGQLIMELQMLENVEVYASRKMIENQGSNLVVNVANTALSEAGTALDILRNAPKIFLNRGGQISVIGRGPALIYLDGQRITAISILDNLSSSDIKKVEIIESPGAKYDAEGNAVVNIVTKSKSLEGYKIGLLQRFGKGKHYRSYFQADSYYKINQWMFQANYGIRPWSWGGRNQQTRSHQAWDAFSEVDNQFFQKNTRLDHNFSFRTAFQPGVHTTLGLLYNGSLVDGQKEATSLRTALGKNQRGFVINSNILGPYLQKSNTVTTYLQQSLDTLGSNFQLTAQYSGFNFDRQEDIQQVLNQEKINQNINRSSANVNSIEIFTLQADYQHFLGNGIKWDIGLKNAHISNNSQVAFRAIEEDGSSRELPEFSNKFNYNENIFAGYSQLNWHQQSTSVTAGLRGEWTKTATRDYFNLFPSVSVATTFKNKAKANLDYGYRINRPLFQDLNPYVLFVDSLISLRGNPGLVPEYSHNVTLGLNWKQWNCNLNYTFTKHKINQIFRSLDPNNPEVISFVKENLNHTRLYMISLSRPFNYKGYTAYVTAGVFFDDHQVRDAEQVLINDQAGYYFQVNQSVRLPWELRLDAVFNYTSSRVDGVYIDNPISYVNISLSRRFFRDHLKVTLWGNDVFDKFKYTGITNFNQMSATYLSEGDYHYLRLALNWDFGKLGTANLNGKQVSRSELNRINRNQN